LAWRLTAFGFVGLALAPNYPVALASMVVAGCGGSFFHPAATALVADLFPSNTGRALGLIGTGAGAGFFVGPIYAGWRAAQSGDWRTPILELGVLGMVGAGLFFNGWRRRRGPPLPRRRSASTWKTVPPPDRRMAVCGGRSGVQSAGFRGNSMGSLGFAVPAKRPRIYGVWDRRVALSGIFVATVI
jgi:MFS family permease